MLCCDGCGDEINPDDEVLTTREARFSDTGVLNMIGKQKVFCKKCLKAIVK